MKSIHLRPEDVIHGELRELRHEKEITIHRRKDIDHQLSDLNTAIKKKVC